MQAARHTINTQRVQRAQQPSIIQPSNATHAQELAVALFDNDLEPSEQELVTYPHVPVVDVSQQPVTIQYAGYCGALADLFTLPGRWWVLWRVLWVGGGMGGWVRILHEP